ncbi:MAG: 3-deoxy-manno-octulosonate cytidylyltransferase [Porticoccaceae bacterium]
MNFNVVIPARFASTRLPGKPLRDIAGMTMIERVYHQAGASAAARVVVATDDERIATTVRGFGGEVVLTAPTHPSGTDRLWQAAQLCGFAADSILVNVQGDEPLIPPAVINQVAANLAANPAAGVATLCEPIDNLADFTNPNIVKVVVDARNYARYFSRAPIPWPRDQFAAGAHTLPSGFQPRRHIGLYAYRVGLLDRFVAWPVAPIEALEALEQLRFLWHGEVIHVADAVAAVPAGVDTAEDLARIINLLTNAGSP